MTTENVMPKMATRQKIRLGLPVSAMAKSGNMKNSECILCGTCVDTCPNRVIKYSWGKPENP